MNEDPRDLLRRHLEQRRELGESELFLEGHTANEAMDLLRLDRADARDLAARTAVEARAEAPAPGAAAGEIVQIGDLATLRETALGCPRCRLAETRQHVVFGEGSETAGVVVVGEAPGAEEDRTGRPFVGAAGKMLTRLLAAIGVAREEVYICNVLKCRPPGNRNPQPEEVEACSPYLLRQIELIRPRVILACGTFAAQTLLRTTTPISRLRTEQHLYHGVPLVPTYHPAALLRNPVWVRAAWEDLQRLRRIRDAAATARA